MRAVTPEERALFLAALRLPGKTAKQDKPANTAEPAKTVTPAPRKKAIAAGGKGSVSAEDVALFLEAIGKGPRRKAIPVVPAPVIAPKPRPPKAAGIDGNTQRRLEKGDIHPSAQLDLHGLTEAAAHGALLTFLHTAHRRGDRLVLIVTGKGALEEAAPKARYGGVLRRAVPRWLEEAPMASIIADKRWAHRRHGGDGALYIYLRKRS
jgi:DNA-nicking Smr family endonuclease